MKRAVLLVGVLVVACGGRVMTISDEQEYGGSGNGGAPSTGRAGSPPTPSAGAPPAGVAGAPYQAGAPSFGGAPYYAGAPSFGGGPYYAGAPSFGGGPYYAGAPSFGGAPYYAGAPSYAGSPSFGGAGGSVPAGTEGEQLAWYAKSIQGTWVGSRSTPTWGGPDAKVTFTFYASTYSARCLEPNCVALYYGSDDDSPEKKYRLDDITAITEAQGDITVWFAPGSTNPGIIQHVWISGNQLTFEVYKTGYGPLVYTLVRVAYPGE